MSGVLSTFPLWYIVISTLIAGLSVISNVIVLSVWLRKSVRSHITIALSLLAISDCIAVIFGGIFVPVTDMISVKEGCVLFSIGEYVAFLAHSLSIIITTLISLQRFAICAFPFTGPSFCTNAKLFVCMMTCLFLTVIFTMFTLKTNISGSIESSDNCTVIVCHYEYMFKRIKHDEKFFNIYNGFRLICLQLIPMTIISISMTYCIYAIYFVRKTMIERKATEQRKINKITMMICVLMFVFIIGEVPTTLGLAVDVFAKNSTNSFLRWISFSSDGVGFCNIMLFLSYFMNMCIYVTMSEHFRKELIKLFSVRFIACWK